MNHLSEHTLELFVLGGGKDAVLRKQVEEHVAICRGCNRLLESIKTYYEEAEAEARKPVRNSALKAGRLPARRRKEAEGFLVSPVSEPPAYIEVRVPTIWRRIHKFSRENRAVSAFAVLAFAAVTYLLLSYAFRDDPNPAYCYLDTAKHQLEVYNAGNKLLWELPSFWTAFNTGPGADNAAIADLDRDGRNELITCLPIGSETQPMNLKVFDSRGKLAGKFSFPKTPISYDGDSYHEPLGFSAVSTETLPDGSVDLLVTSNDRRSPSLVARLDSRLKIIGEYWHYGTFSAYPYSTGDKLDNRLLLAGSDDAEDMKGKDYSFAAVLDPLKITGKTESSVTPGFGMRISPAEIYYIRFPLTDLGKALGQRCFASPDGLVGDSLMYISVKSSRAIPTTIAAPRNAFGFEYIFDVKTMRVRQVKFLTPTEQTYAELKREGKVHGTFNQRYLDNLMHGVRYWTGSKWVKEPTKVKHGESKAG